MTPWIEAIQFNIDHVGEPGERMPIGYFCACKSPENAFSGQPRLHMAIFRNIYLVI